MKKYLYLKLIFLTILIVVTTFSNLKTSENVACADMVVINESVLMVEPSTNNKNSIVSPEATSVIALLLNPHISAAIDNYFGEPTQYALYDAVIKEIGQVGSNFAYRVKISVPTFHGPHNPPYGIETMTFTIRPSGVVLDNYVHQNK